MLIIFIICLISLGISYVLTQPFAQFTEVARAIYGADPIDSGEIFINGEKVKIKTPEDAALYYTIVEEVLGKEWLTPELFRIGASSAANNLISAIEDKVVNYF